jgi:hypothetical protein
MGKKEKKPEEKTSVEAMVSEIDFSEGFGGIPENVSLTKNIVCASNSKDKVKNYQKKE